MAVGPWIRGLLPARVEKVAADAYRGLFVDLDKVAGCLASHVPEGVLLLDVGSGDGDLLNRLLALRADLSVDMVDIAGRIGALLDARYETRVRRFPSTTLAQHASAHAGLYGAALISDVMHHVPPEERVAFLRATTLCLKSGGTAFIKDVEPGHPLAALGWLCDRYLSGDKGVSLVSKSALRELVDRAVAVEGFEEVGLHSIDRPNYLVKVTSPTISQLPAY